MKWLSQFTSGPTHTQQWRTTTKYKHTHTFDKTETFNSNRNDLKIHFYIFSAISNADGEKSETKNTYRFYGIPWKLHGPVNTFHSVCAH